MAQAAVPPPNDLMSSTFTSKLGGAPSAGRTPAANGHYVNGSAATSDASSERIQIIDDEKQFTYVALRACVTRPAADMTGPEALH